MKLSKLVDALMAKIPGIYNVRHTVKAQRGNGDVEIFLIARSFNLTWRPASIRTYDQHIPFLGESDV